MPEAQTTRELLRKVRRIEIVTRRLVQHQMAGSYHSVFKGRGMSFDEVRLYQPGDEVRLIDWNVTARTGEVFVKRFVEERELTVMIAVDVSASMSTGSGDATRREVAAELAAVVALSAMHNGDRVGLLLFADDIVRYLPPKKSRGHGLRVIREVLAADARASTLERVPGAPRERKGLAGALAYLGLIQRRRAVVFLVSDFLDIEGVEREVRALVQRHDLIPLHLRDPLDLAMPPLGTALAEDPECRERRLFLPFGFKSFRRRYTAAVQAQIASVEHLFHHAGTDIVPVDLGESPVRPLARYFRLRTRRQG